MAGVCIALGLAAGRARAWAFRLAAATAPTALAAQLVRTSPTCASATCTSADALVAQMRAVPIAVAARRWAFGWGAPPAAKLA